MASVAKDDELRSFDVPEAARHPGGYTIYKIILQVTPKELTENSYQILIEKDWKALADPILMTFVWNGAEGDRFIYNEIFLNDLQDTLIYWKRYTDIRKLYDTLHRYHLAIYRPGKFPDFPEKSAYAERFNPAVVEQRRVATKQFLNYAVQQLYLRTHDAYINFFQKGEKVLLPDVTADTLKPQTAIRTSSSPTTVPDLPTTVQPLPTDEKKDEVLFDVDEQDPPTSGPSTRVIDDLNDLSFEQSNINTDQSDPLDLLSTTERPAASSETNNNDAS